MTEKKFKHIVRIANTDLDGNKAIYPALRKIKGISFAFSNALCKICGIDPQKKTGYLSEDEIKKLEQTSKNPSEIPTWMFNRRRDYEDNLDKHLITSTLKLTKESDIKRMKKIKSYKGMRHAFGLPVRGQRTRSNFRKGKSIGVQKKKIKQARVEKK